MPQEDEDFTLIDNDDSLAIDFHNNHQIQKKETLKMKFYQKMYGTVVLIYLAPIWVLNMLQTVKKLPRKVATISLVSIVS